MDPFLNYEKLFPLRFKDKDMLQILILQTREHIANYLIKEEGRRRRRKILKLYIILVLEKEYDETKTSSEKIESSPQFHLKKCR